MKPRHIAALAIASWYLMMPPPGPHRVSGLGDQCVASDDPQVTQYQDFPKVDGFPLWQWNTVAVFADKEDCQEALIRDFWANVRYARPRPH
jgi:hypothetical protein